MVESTAKESRAPSLCKSKFGALTFCLRQNTVPFNEKAGGSSKKLLKDIINPRMPSFLFYRKPSGVGGDTDVQCSAFRGHTIRIFAVKGGRPAVLRRQGENMKKNIGKIKVLK